MENSDRVTELSRKCGLKGVELHTLRHTHASELLTKGVPIIVVSERLGHANPSITLSIYTHAMKADELAAAEIGQDAMAQGIATDMRSNKTLVSGSIRFKRLKAM